MQKVKYLGHIVSEEGIETDREKVQKVLNWPTLIHQKKLGNLLDSSDTIGDLFQILAKSLNLSQN